MHTVLPKCFKDGTVPYIADCALQVSARTELPRASGDWTARGQASGSRLFSQAESTGT